VCRPLPHAGPPVPSVESWPLPSQAAADRDAARVGSGQSGHARPQGDVGLAGVIRAARCRFGHRPTRHRGVLRALTVERQRVVAAWLDTCRSAVARQPSYGSAELADPSPGCGWALADPTMWQSRPHHGLSRDLGDLRPHASRNSPRSTKRRRKRPNKSRETGRNALYSGRESHNADPLPRYGSTVPHNGHRSPIMGPRPAVGAG
jgi:hypothetical protein